MTGKHVTLFSAAALLAAGMASTADAVPLIYEGFVYDDPARSVAAAVAPGLPETGVSVMKRLLWILRVRLGALFQLQAIT